MMIPEGDKNFRQDLTDLLVWGVKCGWRLLGRPVNIRLTEDGLGYTHNPHQGVPLVINVNPKVLQEDRGTHVLRGLILHELGHHFAHFSDPNFKAVFDRCKVDYLARMLNIIEDEHLERRLRGLDPEWGEAFDALASYAFKGKPMVLLIEQYQTLLKMNTTAEVRDALDDGRIPGKSPAGNSATVWGAMWTAGSPASSWWISSSTSSSPSHRADGCLSWSAKACTGFA